VLSGILATGRGGFEEAFFLQPPGFDRMSDAQFERWSARHPATDAQKTMWVFRDWRLVRARLDETIEAAEVKAKLAQLIEAYGQPNTKRTSCPDGMARAAWKTDGECDRYEMAWIRPDGARVLAYENHATYGDGTKPWYSLEVEYQALDFRYEEK